LACGKARGGRIPRSGSVTDEPRSHRPNSAQPEGRQLFFGQTSLLADLDLFAFFDPVEDGAEIMVDLPDGSRFDMQQ
jgi:hypothetical protein